MNRSLREERKGSASTGHLDTISHIDQLYRQQIRDIYADSKAKIEQQHPTTPSHQHINPPSHKQLQKTAVTINHHWHHYKPTPNKSTNTLPLF